MRKVINLYFICVVVFLISCAPTTQTSTPADSRAELIKQSRALTHKLVCSEAVFSEGIPELLPKGIQRMTDSELSSTTVNSINAKSFTVGSSSSGDVQKLLGTPIREDYKGKGIFIYSYDGSNYSYVAYVFDSNKVLTHIHGYSNSNPW